MTRSRRSSVEILEKCGDGQWNSTEHLPSRRQKILTTLARLRVLPRLRRPSFTRSSVLRRREQNPALSPGSLISWRNVKVPSPQLTDSKAGGTAEAPELVPTRGPDQEGSTNPEVLADEQPHACVFPIGSACAL
jgi:hypothetical protein